MHRLRALFDRPWAEPKSAPPSLLRLPACPTPYRPQTALARSGVPSARPPFYFSYRFLHFFRVSCQFFLLPFACFIRFLFVPLVALSPIHHFFDFGARHRGQCMLLSRPCCSVSLSSGACRLLPQVISGQQPIPRFEPVFLPCGFCIWGYSVPGFCRCTSIQVLM